MIRVKLFDFLIQNFNTPFVQVAASGYSAEEKASKSLLAVFLVILIPVLIALFCLIIFIYRRTVGKKLRTTVAEDDRKEAEGYEKAGEFVSAANIYDSKLKNPRKAAELYEKGGDYKQAAMLYDFLGLSSKAKEMYEKSGNLEDAAEVALMEGEFDEAAALYDKAGKKIDAAKVMQQSGKTIYAVKALREAGEYKKAALLLKQEGMLKEAAEMFGFYLYDKKPESSNLEDYYAYALMLESTGQIEKAVEVFKEINQCNPMFKDVKDRLKVHMMPPSQEVPTQEVPVPEGRTTLRSFIPKGGIEPRYGLRLWVHILKSLKEAYENGWSFGNLNPDNIIIDGKNNISFLKRIQSPDYIPPEVLKEVDLDERADIYSAGVILYEMLTGGLKGLGSVGVIDTVENVPEWLDDIVIRCLRKVREDRYQSIKDIFTDLKAIKDTK